MQTYASGPTSQVNSILWPNPAFANNITVFGPEVKALAGRYLMQMLDDIRALPDPDGVADSLLASIELIVPHQANKTMVIDLAKAAGLSPDQLYFNIEQVGNTSSASIPLAIHDAVRDRCDHHADPGFCPGFRCRRGCGLWGSPNRSCCRRARRPGGTNWRVCRGSRASRHARRGRDGGGCLRITTSFGWWHRSSLQGWASSTAGSSPGLNSGGRRGYPVIEFPNRETAPPAGPQWPPGRAFADRVRPRS